MLVTVLKSPDWPPAQGFGPPARSRLVVSAHQNFGRALKVELSYVEAMLGPFPPERLRAAGVRVPEEAA